MDFLTALLVDRHKRGRLRHRGRRAIKGLPKGANANEALPVVGRSKGYENQTTRISTGSENNAKAIPLKEQLSNEVLKSRGTKLENLEVSA